MITLRILKLPLNYVDVMNCCIIWFAYFMLKNAYSSIPFLLLCYILYLGWLPFIYGFTRIRHFRRKSIKEILLFVLNIATVPVYLFMALAAYLAFNG